MRQEHQVRCKGLLHNAAQSGVRMDGYCRTLRNKDVVLVRARAYEKNITPLNNIAN